LSPSLEGRIVDYITILFSYTKYYERMNAFDKLEKIGGREEIVVACSEA
jgi:hypothetical protein